MHNGYTGTTVCNDPERELITVLLSARLFPDDTNSTKHKMWLFRHLFNSEVQKIFDAQNQYNDDNEIIY